MANPVTEWDAQGNPITSDSTTQVREWDADGNPIQQAAVARPEQPGFWSNLGHAFGIGKDEAEARRQNLNQHPVRTILEDQPVVGLVKSAYQGGKRMLGELQQAGSAAMQGNGAAAASHAISAVPFVGPGMDAAVDAAQANGMNAPGNSYGKNLGIAATTPGTLGAVAGTSAQVAPMVLGAVDTAAPGRPTIPTPNPVRTVFNNFQAPARAVKATAAELEAARANTAPVDAAQQAVDASTADTGTVNAARQARDAAVTDTSAIDAAQQARDAALKAKASRTAAEREAARRVTDARMAEAQAQQDAELAARHAARKAQVADPKVVSDSAINVLNDIAKSEKFEPLQATTIREAVPEIAQQYRGRSTAGYQSVEKAAGGEIKSLQEEIYDTTAAIKANKLLDPAKAAEQAKYLETLEAQKKAAIDTAVQNGMKNAQEVIKKADADWRTYRSLEDYGKKLATKAGETQTGGIPTARGFALATDQAINNGRLPKALGEKAPDIKNVAINGLRRAQSAKAASAAAKASDLGVKAAADTKTTAVREARGLIKRTNRAATDAEQSVTEAQRAHEKAVAEAEKAHEKAAAEHDRSVAQAEKARERAEKLYQRSVDEAKAAHDEAKQRLTSRNRKVLGALSGAAGAGAAYGVGRRLSEIFGAEKQ